MNQLSPGGTEWRSSTSMIYLGILALTIFGCAASFCEFFFGSLDTVKGYLDNLFNAAAYSEEQSHAEGFFKFYTVYNRLSFWTRTFEVLTIGGWIAYVIGLSKFRQAQATEKGRWLTGSLYSACWLGLVAMACSFIGSFLGLFGCLFRFVGWVLNLISLFKFRGAFNHLSIEESWNHLAQLGAKNLRSSYTFGIILAFYPLIVFLTVLFIGLGSISSIPGIARNLADEGMNVVASLIGGSIAIFILLGLTALVLWICQVCYLLSGWCKIKNGCPADNENDEYVSDNSTIMTLGAIFATFIFMGIVLWSCVSPLTQKGGTYTIQKKAGADDASFTEDKTYSEEYEKPASTYSKQKEEATSFDEAEDQDNQAANEYTYNYKGTINNKYGIEMTLITDGGAYYNGEYFYIKDRQPIQLRGQLTEDGYEYLVLEEYVGMNMTGKFEGTLTRNAYSGTWTSADGEKSYPFSVTRK